MKSMCCFLLLCLISPVCLAGDVFCGKVEKFFFAGPDWKQGDEKYEAIMLKFNKMKKIKYKLLDDARSHVYADVSRIHIIPSLDSENGELSFKILADLVGKKVCVSGEAIQSHTAHHVPPVILWGPKLSSARHY